LSASVRHRLELAAFLGVRAGVRALPHRAARAAGAALGALAWAVDRRHRRVVESNLALAFPDWPARRRRQVARACFRHIGATVFDTLSVGRLAATDLCERLTLEGWEHLVSAQEQGRGTLLLSAHLGNWELAGHAASLLRGPVHAVARPFDNSLVYERVTRERARFGQSLIAKQRAAVPVLRVLRRGGTVGLIMDQRVRPGQGIVLPFFGHPALTTPLPASLSLRTGAPAVPLFAHPEPGGRYRLEALPAIQPTGDGEAAVAALTARYLGVIEQRIREHPAQWLWMHRRWRLD
jgi:Kdo2-lipid IVA lauroyltransferase/acyltransferase